MAGDYDLILASQPWRGAHEWRSSRRKKILAPLSRALSPGGRLLVIESCGKETGARARAARVAGREPLRGGPPSAGGPRCAPRWQGKEAREFTLSDPPDDKAILRYEMHTLPSEIGNRVGTSTLFAAWNAAIYVAQDRG